MVLSSSEPKVIATDTSRLLAKLPPMPVRANSSV